MNIYFSSTPNKAFVRDAARLRPTTLTLACKKMNKHEQAEFKVTDHYHLNEKGGFVIGQIKSGTFRIGMTVPVGELEALLTISGIEYLEYIDKKKFFTVLIFEEKPSIEYVKNAFPVGVVLHANN